MVFANFSIHTAYVFYSILIIEKLSENGTQITAEIFM